MELLEYWFPDDNYHCWWFKSTHTIDQTIYSKFYNQMTKIFDNFDINLYTNATPSELTYSIILLDQVSRNINRILNILDINEYTKRANQLSNIWINQKYYLTEPVKYTVFALMPIRHCKHIGSIDLVYKILELMEADKNELCDNKIFIKFKFYTKKSLELLTVNI
jgi:uncharacterized protein (DUF924 family)